MKLKNQLIIALVQSGLGSTTEHDLPGDAAYNAFRFRRSCVKAYNDLGERQAELRAEAGEDEERFKELNAALLNDETEVWASPLSVRDYLILAAENRKTRLPVKDELYIDLFRVLENDLEGVLWTEETNQ